MNIKRKPLELHNVIIKNIYDTEMNTLEIGDLDINYLQKGVFATGPVLIEKNWNNEKQSLCIPVNRFVTFQEGTDISCKDVIRVEDGIYYRSGEEKIEKEYLQILMKKISVDLGKELENVYYEIYLNVYGGKLVDIYAPFRE